MYVFVIDFIITSLDETLKFLGHWVIIIAIFWDHKSSLEAVLEADAGLGDKHIVWIVKVDIDELQELEGVLLEVLEWELSQQVVAKLDSLQLLRSSHDKDRSWNHIIRKVDVCQLRQILEWIR